jgi:hypothetical protein
MIPTNQHTRSIQAADTTLLQRVRPDIIVTSGIPELDVLLGGFKAGETTLVDGTSTLIAELPDRLSVNTYRTFHAETIYLDAGMRADPYRIARYARAFELDQQEVLENIVISRAFTVYQLSTLIRDLLEPLIRKRSPRTLVIGMLPALYSDPDVQPHEAHTLLAGDLVKLKELTTRYNLITVATNLDALPLSPARGLGKILYEHASDILQMKQFDHTTRLALVKQQKNATIIHGTRGQLRLEEFGMVL